LKLTILSILTIHEQFTYIIEKLKLYKSRYIIIHFEYIYNVEITLGIAVFLEPAFTVFDMS